MDFVHPLSALFPGAHARVLSVLAQTTAELNLRTVARLSGVSPAQASRVLPVLVDLGVVVRREVAPSSLFQFNRMHVTAPAIAALTRSHEEARRLIGDETATAISDAVSVILFGSFARGEADAHSDIDALIVRPDHVSDDDPDWGDGVETWRGRVREITGNAVNVLELSARDARDRLSAHSPLWQAIAIEGDLVSGLSMSQLSGGAGA